jgi:hypothetical protein
MIGHTFNTVEHTSVSFAGSKYLSISQWLVLSSTIWPILPHPSHIPAPKTIEYQISINVALFRSSCHIHALAHSSIGDHASHENQIRPSHPLPLVAFADMGSGRERCRGIWRLSARLDHRSSLLVPATIIVDDSSSL